MNHTLYYSSIVLGACMLVMSFIVKYVPRLAHVYAITFLAIITSIMNHGSTNRLYKLFDRFIIYVGAIVYIYYIFLIKSSLRKAVALCIIVAMILLYMYSKYVKHYKKQEYTHYPSKINLLRLSLEHLRYFVSSAFSHIHLLCHVLAVVLFYIIISSGETT
jgi:hypothetical protein